MQIKIDSIEMKNFMIYRDCKIENLSNKRLILIAGVNASGKSTLTSESLFFNIFGRSLRYSSVSELVSYDAKSGSVKVTYSVDGIPMRLTRNITGNPRYEIETEHKDLIYLTDNLSVPNFNKAIKELIDIDEDKFVTLYLKSPFSNIIFEDSGNSLLSSITKSDYIHELRMEFADKIKGFKREIDTINQNVLKQSELANSVKETIDKIANNDIDKDADKLKELRENINNIELLLKKSTGELQATDNDFERKNKKKSDYQRAIDKIYSTMADLKKNADRLNSLTKQGKCHTCGQLIDSQLYSGELDELRDTYKNENSRLKKGEKLKDDLVLEFNELRERRTNIQRKINELNIKLRELSSEIGKIEGKLKSNKDNKSNNREILSKIRKTVADLNNQLNELKSEFSILDSINKVMLNKKSEYINIFYRRKIKAFTDIFKMILSRITKGKFTDIEMQLNNRPIINNHINYNALSSSERKSVDISFMISFIIYLSKKLKLKSFVLDEFFDNYDLDNARHLCEVLYSIAVEYDLQLFIATNYGNTLMSNLKMSDCEVIYVNELHNN